MAKASRTSWADAKRRSLQEVKGRTPAEQRATLARHMLTVLHSVGIVPDHLGIDVVICAEFAQEAEAKACAEWFAKSGFRVLDTVPADADIGYGVRVDIGAAHQRPTSSERPCFIETKVDGFRWTREGCNERRSGRWVPYESREAAESGIDRLKPAGRSHVGIG